MADQDAELRVAAVRHAVALADAFGDHGVPLATLREGFPFLGRRVSYGSFFKGIFRPREMAGPSALVVVTAPPTGGRLAPYDDEFDDVTASFTYHFRTARTDSFEAARLAEADNDALRAAAETHAPLVYFKGLAPGLYEVIAPVVITGVDEVARTVRLQTAFPDFEIPSLGLEVDVDVRRYATRQARDGDPHGVASVVNGIALCSIHHRAYDRNLMGIDPRGTVHIARRLREEEDGPMLKNGLQGFHGSSINQPRRRDERPDTHRLEVRYEEFRAAA